MEDLIKKQSHNSKLIANFVQNFNKTAKDKRDNNFINARLCLLEKYWASFVQGHYEVVSASNSADEEKYEYFLNDVYADVECTYIETLAWLTGLLGETSSNTIRDESMVMNSSTSGSETKLPRITIPPFSGDYLEWTAFKDMFTTLIANNSNLTNVQRLHYLKANVRGEAELLIRNYTITDANYTSAWNALTERYENLHVLVQVHIEAILNAPAVHQETAHDLKRLMNRISESTQALANLKRPVDQWDDWLTCIVARKFDAQTRKEWESLVTSSKDLPVFKDIQNFLLSRIRILEAVGTSKLPKPPRLQTTRHIHSNTTTTNTIKTNSANDCSLCSGRHFIMFCRQFKQLPVEKRRNFVTKEQLCQNCLRKNHSHVNCSSTFRCRHCDGQHHTMLHQEGANHPTGQGANHPTGHTTTSFTSSISHIATPGQVVLLATALVDIFTASSERLRFRALVDQGSQSSFISEFCAQCLQIPRRKTNFSVNGICGVLAGTARGMVSIRCSSTINPEFTFECNALILNRLTTAIRTIFDKPSTWTHLANIQLADPHFLQPDRVDVILGADVYGQLLLGDLRKGGYNEPVAQNTSLGWIVSGPTSCESPIQPLGATTACNAYALADMDLNNLLTNFWQIEEVPSEKLLTDDEAYCEDFYNQTVQRDSNGRYVVRLPLPPLFQTNIQLGHSRQRAIQRLHQMERRFQTNPELQSQYVSFMDQYKDLGHMQLVTPPSFAEEKTNMCYIPHHCVLKEDSVTTKLRVVFDASSKTTNGYALNDRLLVGPKLQRDICAIIFNWRRHRFVFTADVEKMFRQITVNELDRNLQRIVWRNSPSEDIQDYQLTTVTYGTASAPFLALKTLQRLAQDEATKFPRASQVLLTDTYVDDILSGADDIETALQLQQELIELLTTGGFQLRKWAASRRELTTHLPPDFCNGNASLNLSKADPIKTLGISWLPEADQFRFQVRISESHSSPTKRTMLSDISKLYDPLGWLAPVIIVAKIMIQQLWLLNLGWDDLLPSQIATKWNLFSSQLKLLEDIRINRWISTSANVRCELHGFADASLSAYAAVLYVRVITPDGNISVHLISSKSKVSPTKTVSLPRLELCGAVLLTRLMRQFISESISFDSIHAWTDSTVVLAWIRSHPSRWKVFVANRVSEIQQTISPSQWSYVATKQNAADCASRGLYPSELKQHLLWWNGPSFLLKPQLNCTTMEQTPSPEAFQEERTATIVHMAEINTSWELLNHFSSLSKLLRITAYIFRFVNNCRRSTSHQQGYLTANEINLARSFWIREEQRVAFSSEIENLNRKLPVSLRSSIRSLNPIMDDDRILRVGGRLRNSFLPYSEQHPIILPKASHLSSLIVMDAHSSTLHGGPQLTFSYVRRQYWILKGRSLIQKRLRNCINCIRNRPKPASQIMADLPAARVTPSRPFLHCGIDYAGPITLKSSRGRGYRSFKGYVAVFVCLCTKAVHLEAVSSMTTDDFLAAFNRFIARRGICSDLYSDRGTNFIGASRELKTLFKEAPSTWQSVLGEALAMKNITWHFIPPYSPHFGGIWEAAVKSFKRHFRCIVKDRTLTFEEISTLLAGIEACLNSRPLCARSEDPEEMESLTPGHFLIGGPLITIPETNLLETKSNPLGRWKLLLQMKQHFWHQWSKDYLQTLQQRSKWVTTSRNPEIGELVLLKEERLSPTKWILGRIEAIHPGSDGQVRVATVRCRGTTCKRPITKICYLPQPSDI